MKVFFIRSHLLKANYCVVASRFAKKNDARAIGIALESALAGTSWLFVRRREMSHSDGDDNAVAREKCAHAEYMKSGHKRLNGAGHLRQWACSANVRTP